MKLLCPDCGSDQVVKFGEKSELDGKSSYRCEACQLEMGPMRSRFKLWALTLVSLALAFGMLGVVLFREQRSLVSGLICGTFAAFAAAGFKEMRKPQPLRVEDELDDEQPQ
jgi:hypothetical protein